MFTRRSNSVNINWCAIMDQDQSFPPEMIYQPKKCDHRRQSVSANNKLIYRLISPSTRFQVAIEKSDAKKNPNLVPFEERLSTITFTDRCVYGGYEDGTIMSWNLKDGEYMDTMKQHTKRVTGIQMLNLRVLVSSSQDGSIIFWDTMTANCEVIFKFAEKVDMFNIHNKRIYFIINNASLHFIDSDKNEVKPLKIFNEYFITAFHVFDKYLIAGTSKNTLELNEITADGIVLKQSVVCHNEWIHSIKKLNNTIFSAADDKKIFVWEMGKDPANPAEEILVYKDELVGHNDGVISMEFCDENLYSGSLDNYVLAWELKEIFNRIRERRCMYREDIMSRRLLVFENYLEKKIKKKKSKKKTKKGTKDAKAKDTKVESAGEEEEAAGDEKKAKEAGGETKKKKKGKKKKKT
eukprot:TRINITY_DN5423_c0_g1_i3.p1 TRINITY_DN5423_c0_g1~~TRINITY_DN5423_c0_g1_i3.p1  ORF type:complete len:408 (+),score=64.93 TRINITY_DN5423_c0_g1_i3:124-1347(+)